MRKIFKKGYIFSFILGAIVFGSVGTYAAYSVLADNIGYTPKDTTWKKANGEDITNVKDAIDELYTEANKDILTRLDLSTSKVTSMSLGGNKGSKHIELNLNKGKYLVIGAEGTAYNSNSLTAGENNQSYYPKVELTNGTCTYLKGVGNASIATSQVNNTNQDLVMRSAIHICSLTDNDVVRVSTIEMGDSSTENTNLIVHAIKLD